MGELAPLGRLHAAVLAKDGPLGPQMVVQLETKLANGQPFVIQRIVDILEAEKGSPEMMQQRMRTVTPHIAAVLLETFLKGGWGKPGEEGFTPVQGFLPLEAQG